MRVPFSLSRHAVALVAAAIVISVTAAPAVGRTTTAGLSIARAVLLTHADVGAGWRSSSVSSTPPITCPGFRPALRLTPRSARRARRDFRRARADRSSRRPPTSTRRAPRGALLRMRYCVPICSAAYARGSSPDRETELPSRSVEHTASAFRHSRSLRAPTASAASPRRSVRRRTSVSTRSFSPTGRRSQRSASRVSGRRRAGPSNCDSPAGSPTAFGAPEH